MYFLCDYIKLVTITFKKKNSDRNLVSPNEYIIFIHLIIGCFDHSKLELFQKGLNIELLVGRDGHLLEYIACPNCIPCLPSPTCISYYFSFCVSGSQAELSWCLYFRVSHKTVIKVLVEAMDFSRLAWGKICFQVHLPGRSQKIHYEADSWDSWQVSDSLSVSWIHPFQACEPLRRATHSMETCFPPTPSEAGRGRNKEGEREMQVMGFLQRHPITLPCSICQKGISRSSPHQR